MRSVTSRRASSVKSWPMAQGGDPELCTMFSKSIIGAHSELGQGRYTWYHNQVLKHIGETISKGIRNCSWVLNTSWAAAFVKAGEQLRIEHKRSAAGILAAAQD